MPRFFLGWTIIIGIGFVTLSCSNRAATTHEFLGAGGTSLLSRAYKNSETVEYVMIAENVQPSRKISYTAESIGDVVVNPDGPNYEQTGWKKLIVNDVNVPLSPADLAFRQKVSLDPSFDMQLNFPRIADADPRLTGPILDLLNFYADVQLAMKQTSLQAVGDHEYISYSRPASYADPGRGVILGEVCIDFDLTLTALTPTKATLVIKHVPPPVSCVKLSSAWMKESVVDNVFNNHVQINKNRDGTFEVAVGKEDIDVTVEVEIGAGRILSAKMHNPVEIRERTCSDEFYETCFGDKRYQILREITLFSK